MLSAICVNLDQSEILSSGNGLMGRPRLYLDFIQSDLDLQCPEQKL